MRTGNPGRPRRLYQIVTATDEDHVFEDAEPNLDEYFTGAAEVSLRDALHSNEKNEWMNAIVDEFETLIKNNAFKVVKVSPNQKTVVFVG